MRLAVRPPEYFPRLAYVALFGGVDCFVIADTFPYSRQSYQNRCRIRTAQTNGSTWLSIPLAGSASGKSPLDICVAEETRWRSNHWKSILHHLGSSPFFSHFEPEIRAILETSFANLADITSKTTIWLAKSLFPETKIIRASELTSRNQSLADILKTINPTTFVTLPESADRDCQITESFGLTVEVLDFREQPRRQNFPGFVPDCSSLDLLLNYGPAARSLVQ